MVWPCRAGSRAPMYAVGAVSLASGCLDLRVHSAHSGTKPVNWGFSSVPKQGSPSRSQHPLMLRELTATRAVAWPRGSRAHVAARSALEEAQHRCRHTRYARTDRFTVGGDTSVRVERHRYRWCVRSDHGSDPGHTVQASISWNTTIGTDPVANPHKTIYAQLRTTMYSAKVEKVHYDGPSVRSVIKSGTVKAPSAIGWAVWEK